MSIQLLRRRFTVQEYNQMAEAGILSEDDRLELIEGEIVEMSPIGKRHAACVDRLNRLFSLRLQQRVIVRVQNPIHLSDRSQPQPDVTLLQPRSDFYAEGHPQPEDILLLVEVADTSVDYDREVKVPLYAQAGIYEIWLVDLVGEYVEVYREPAPNGYGEVQQRRRGEYISVQAFPDLDLSVNEVLG